MKYWRALILLLVLTSACKPGAYSTSIRVAAGDSPEERARAAVVQATADAAQEGNRYIREKNTLELSDRAALATIRQDAERQRLEAERSVIIAKGHAEVNVVTEKGQAEADGIRVEGIARAGTIQKLGEAAAMVIPALGLSLSFLLLVASIYLALAMAVYLYSFYVQARHTENVWRVEARIGGLLTTYLLLRDDSGRLFIKDSLTGDSHAVMDPVAINDFRARLLVEAAQASRDAQPGILVRAFNWLLSLGKRQGQVIAPSRAMTVEVQHGK